MAARCIGRTIHGSTNLSFSQISSRIFSSLSTNRTAPYCTQTFIDVGQPSPSSHPELMREGEITPGISSQEYIERRNELISKLPEGTVAVIGSAPVKMMTDVVPYPFRQDADYLYVTGCCQPGGVVVLGKEFGFCMFVPDQDSNEVTWQGQVAGVDEAVDFFKAEKAHRLREMDKVLSKIISRAKTVYHNPKTAFTSPYTKLEAFRTAVEDKRVKDVSRFTHELRWIKSRAEQKLMRESASIACQSLIQTMLHSRVFKEESKLAAKIEYECKMRGAQRMAFNPVVGAGANGSTIHYSRNDQRIREGELVLMDIGCELHGYLSDLTRTWSPFGQFNSAQEELYSLILETNKECIELCKPGTSIREIHDHSVKMLRKGLTKLGILRKEISQSYNELNPTSIGHYLGMDVHDCAMISNYSALQPGVIITIEPGVYIPALHPVADRYQGIGIRIEDEVLITETGHEVLTGSMPKEISQITTLLNMGNNKPGIEIPDMRAAAFSS
ncbi:hypothetical protein LUZ60_017380 [Juncus effusus]|nr:hypothetical protein LUZ60_017380 [Juncus effusus]